MTEPSTSRRHRGWSQKAITAEKAAIRAELDRLAGDPVRRLAAIHARIAALKESVDAGDRLRCVIYIVSALIHHQRYGGLSRRDLRGLVDLAYALLHLSGVRGRNAVANVFFGEVHLALSQIAWLEGRPWVAAWEQQLSTIAGGRTRAGGKGYTDFTMGLRSLRLGNVSMALDLLESALRAGLEPTRRIRAFVEMAKAKRLRGDYAAALATAQEGLELPGIEDAERRELLWEQRCVKVQEAGDVSLMLADLKRPGQFHASSFIVEAFLWTRCCRTIRWLEPYPSVRAIAWDPRLKFPANALENRVANHLVTCYDPIVPVAVKVRELGSLIGQRARLITIDKELLVLAASARWLARAQLFAMCALALTEYTALSLRVTDGRSQDCLGMLADTLARSPRRLQ